MIPKQNVFLTNIRTLKQEENEYTNFNLTYSRCCFIYRPAKPVVLLHPYDFSNPVGCCPIPKILKQAIGRNNNKVQKISIPM